MSAESQPHYRDVTVGDLLAVLARDLPQNEALVYRDRGIVFTFAELEREARLIARGLMASDIRRGDRVAVWATNVPEWVVLQFALAKIGAVLVTVNTALRAREVDYLLRQSETSVLFTIRGFRDVDYIDALAEIGALGDGNLPLLRQVFFIGEARPHEFLTPYDELRSLALRVSEAELDRCVAEVDVDDVINMQYTSGTTGFPKGVMLSSRNIVNNGYWLGRGLGYTSADRLCLCVPLFHCFGCVIGVLGAFTHGACLCPIEFFDARKVLEVIERERCTSVYGVPTMFLAEMEDAEFARFELHSLRTGVMAGSLCPESLMKRAIAEMNLHEMTIIYGLTEASPGITQTHRDDTLERRTQTVGTVLPEMEVRISSPSSGAICGVGEPGELCVRGYNIMKGYYNNPTATSEAIDANGWLRTGDEATIDADGYVRITGRIKDLIIRGGENIMPREIEDLLRQHPAIADAYVYGVKSEFFGEEVAAAVRLKESIAASVDEIREFCRGRIARFKIPKYVRFVTEFPMTASGKIQKFRLRAVHEDELQTAGSE